MAAHTNSSFSYKTTHPDIKRALENRSRLDNTVQISMPFVKATTTIRMPEMFGTNQIGFTLGLHAIDTDLKWQDIYADKQVGGNALIGYTYDDATGKTKLIYVPDTDPANINIPQQQADAKDRLKADAFFDRGSSLYSTPDGFGLIPPPGITNLKISRNKNGVVGVAEIAFSVPTLAQLEALHRVFLVPGIGMIVEWGQQFASNPNADYGESGLTPTKIQDNLFPWQDKTKRDKIFYQLSVNEYSTVDIFKDFVYPTEGQYGWMYGKVANFSTKGNSDGSYDCTVKIFGQGESSWAYNVRNTVIPPKDACPESSNSVESFLNTTSTGLNLKTLLEAVKVDSPRPGFLNGVIDFFNGSSDNQDPDAARAAQYHPDLANWAGHVVFLKNGNKKEGEQTPDDTTEPNANEAGFGDSEDAYFMTWKFFVNVVLNHEEKGIKGIFKAAGLNDDELKKIALLRPYTEPNYDSNYIGNVPYIDDPYENFVGANQYLRSTDPSIMIIVNEVAATLASQDLTKNRPGRTEELTKITESTNLFSRAGDFYVSANKVGGYGQKIDRGFLSAGVWLNHKAVVQCFLGGKSILDGVAMLLDRMSSATSGFWQLSIDESPLIIDDPRRESGPVSTNYAVVDLNYRESSQYAVDKFLNDSTGSVHVYNKYIRNKDGVLYGSELTECTINLDLPKRLFAQIATLGLVQPNDQNALTSDEGENSDAPTISDPNETLRKMFAITSIADRIKDGPLSGSSIDLTERPKQDRKELLATTCAKVGSQTAAGTAGEGNRVDNTNIIDANTKDEDLEKLISGSRDILDAEPCKTQCASVTEAPPTGPPTLLPQNTSTLCGPLTDSAERTTCERAVAAGITDRTELAQFLAQCKHESKFQPINEGFSYPAARLLAVFPKYFKTQQQAAEYAGKPEKTANYVYANRMGNGPPSSGDGWRYRGRGLIQLTGREAYAACARSTGIDCLNNPDLLSSSYDFAFKSAIWFWKTRVRRRSGEFKTNYSDTTGVTRVVNGGSNGLPDRKVQFSRYNQILGSGQTPAAPTTPQTIQPVANNPAPAPASANVPSGRPQAVTYDSVSGPVTVQIEYNSTKGTAGLAGIDQLRAAGYLNGRLPDNKLIVIKEFAALGSARTWKESGEKIIEMLRAARAAGFNINYGEGYRTLEAQINCVKNKGWTGAQAHKAFPRSLKSRRSGNYIGLCAQPGTSNHGWGLAFDLSINGSLISRGSAAHKWLVANAPRFGFKEDGAEAWHWNYKDRITVPPNNAAQAQTPAVTPTTLTTPPTPTSASTPVVVTGECAQCVQARQILEQATARKETNAKYDDSAERVMREFPYLKEVLRYVEVFPDFMVKNITRDSNDDSSNAFGAAPGTLSISVDMALPGINGIRVGELFWVDRMPAFYRAFGAFQVLTLEDTINNSGWQTKIHGRFNYLGGAWRKAMLQKLEDFGVTKSTATTNTGGS